MNVSTTMLLHQNKTSTFQYIARIVLGLFLSLAGTGHLTFQRIEFLAQVPKWIPVDGNIVVILSGIVEIALGLSLIFLSRYRIQTGWIAATFFVLVFPGNIAQWLNHTDAFGLNTEQARIIRLFFQPVLIIWALWSTGAWKAWRES